MDANDQPRWLPFPRQRRAVEDLLHFSRKVPLQPLTRVCRLQRLADLRAQTSPRIGWSALFMKAYGLVARRFPVLRQAYMPWPWTHLYEHPFSICTLAISREVGSQECLFFPQIFAPESKSLTLLQAEIHGYATRPVWDVGLYRRQLRYCYFPMFLRRFFWWFTMNRSGPKRAKHFGTFGMTSVAIEGADTLHTYSPLTTSLAFGPVHAEGRCFATIIYDHRVTDGRQIGRCLAELERTMLREICAELLSLGRNAA